jgi:hypothetical protein
MHRHIRRAAAVLGAAALLLPSAAFAKGKPEKQEKQNRPAKPAHGKSQLANYVFKGVWNGGGTVTVSGGNARVRKGGLVGKDVAFDLIGARLRVADTNADGVVSDADLVPGDKVVVKARLARTEPGDGPHAARRLVDQTHPAVEDGDDAPEVEQG